MSTIVVNITAPTAVGAAASGEAAVSPLGLFEEVMSAFFAGVDEAADDPKGSAPFAAEGGPDPARHNLDVSKLPDKARPATAAAVLAGQPVVQGEAVSAAPVDVPADGLAEASAKLSPPSLGEVEAGPSDREAPGAAPASDGEATVPAARDPLSVESPMSAPVQAVPTALVATTADPTTQSDTAASTAQAQPPPLPAETAERPRGLAEKDDSSKTVPGANASDTARLHAAPSSAVVRAAAAPEPVPAPRPPAETPQPQPPAPAAELAAAQTVAPAATERPPPAAASAARKSNDKAVRGEHAAPSVRAPQDPPAGPADAAVSTDAPAADRASKLAAHTADAPRAQPAQPAQPDETTGGTPAEPFSRAQAATQSAPVETAQVRGSPETVASLSAQIVKKLGARSTHFDVQLDPAGLGKVNVRVAINADGQVSAALRFDNPQAAAELRSRAGELQRALAQSGFDVSGGLSFDVAQDQGGGYGGQQNAFFNDDNPGHAFRGRAFAAALETAGDAVQAALPGAFSPAGGAAKGVDVRV